MTQTPSGYRDLPALNRIDLTPLEETRESLGRIRRKLGVTDEDLIAGYVEDARDNLTQAEEAAERYGHDDLRLKVARERGSLDRFLKQLCEAREKSKVGA